MFCTTIVALPDPGTTDATTGVPFPATTLTFTNTTLVAAILLFVNVIVNVAPAAVVLDSVVMTPDVVLIVTASLVQVPVPFVVVTPRCAVIPVEPIVSTELSLLSVKTSEPLDHFDLTLVAGIIRTFQGYRGGSAYEKAGQKIHPAVNQHHTIALD